MCKTIHSQRGAWIGHCFLLYSPFFIEGIYSLIIKKFKEPSAYWFYGLYLLLCYLFYGLVCVIHLKWRKKIGEPAVFDCKPKTVKWLLVSVLMGIAASKLGSFIIYRSIFSPMIMRDVRAYFIDFSPRYIGVAGFILQYIYYGFEFTLVTLLIDCAQTTSGKYNLNRKIPWGGIFLALTWGIGHVLTKNSIQDGIHTFLMSLCIGSAYLLPENKKLNTWCAAAAIFFL